MTVIAWDGETLAGDRMRVCGGTPVRADSKVNLIAAPDGRRFLVGCSGCAYMGEVFLAWMRGGDKPSMPHDAEFSAMVIDERRKVWMLSRELVYLQVGRPQWAIGCGADYALGAMAAGKTAVEAVKITSRLDTNCGMGVRAVRF